MNLQNYIDGIKPLDERAMELCAARWNTLGKPLYSLGRLEEMSIRMAGIYRHPMAYPKKKVVVVMAGDNGVVAEGVTQTGQEVTKIVTENMTKENASVCILSSISGADVVPVDVGIVTDCDNPKVINKKVKYGTDNMLHGPAMSREEAVQAIMAGIEVTKDLVDQGYELFATGEMGIGNTTTSSAICAVMLDATVEKVTGKGAGLSSAGLLRKIEVIKESIALNKPDKNDPLDVLSKVGGLDIAGLVGVYIGCAYYKKAVFVDGFISSVAALVATGLAPACKDYIFPSHCSNEPAGHMVLDAMDMQPYILCNMCLGEGTGAVMGFTICDYAMTAYHRLPSFEDTKFGTYEPLD